MTSRKPPGKIGGVESVAEMLNQMAPEDRERLLRELAKRDEGLTEQIRERLFVFDHLVRLDDRSMQLFLREVPSELLAVALRAASDEMKTAIYRALSQRTAAALREEIDAAGPRKISEIGIAQAKLTEIAKTLLAEGKIALRSEE